jgi:hypothetical protein
LGRKRIPKSIDHGKSEPHAAYVEWNNTEDVQLVYGPGLKEISRKKASTGWRLDLIIAV